MVPMVLMDSRYESERKVRYDTADSEQRAYEMVDPAIVESLDTPNEQFFSKFWQRFEVQKSCPSTRLAVNFCMPHICTIMVQTVEHFWLI